MLSNECYLARHETCSAEQYCDCLCHVQPEPLFEKLLEYLMDYEEEAE